MISYIVLRAATRLDKVLGATGMNAMARIMGFLLICIGIQFVINGVLGVVHARLSGFSRLYPDLLQVGLWTSLTARSRNSTLPPRKPDEPISIA